MLQYLLNTTAIWLLSLVIFDLVLRGESYHRYNRYFLLSTLLGGFIIPLIQWPGSAGDINLVAFKDARQIINVGERLVPAQTGTEATGFDFANLAIVIFIAGVCFSLFLLIREVVRLVTLYKNGSKHTEGKLTIVETGKNHGPFSLRNIVFVSGREQYSDNEWQMLISHESAHATLLHFIDMVLLQLCQVAFWFHPLIYVYKKRLLMVHEFQADSFSTENATTYGRFLVEQGVLQVSTSIGHSFNHSPIKKRILMLTHRSAGASRAKTLIAMPLAALCILLFSKEGFSQKFERKGKKVTYKGNTFDMSDMRRDTIILVNPVTAQEEVKVQEIEPKPIKMNGVTIATKADKAPYFNAPNKNLREYLIKKLEGELSQLQDGEYMLLLKNVITDEKGRIVYFDYGGVEHPELRKADRSNALVDQAPIDKQLQESINSKFYEIIERVPTYIPASLNGQNVPAYTGENASYEWFTVKDHKVKF